MLYLHNTLKQPLKIMSLEKILKKKKQKGVNNKKKTGVSTEVSTELETIQQLNNNNWVGIA